MSVLEPLIQSGKIQIPSGKTTFEQTATPGWSTDIAFENMQNTLASYYSNGEMLDKGKENAVAEDFRKKLKTKAASVQQPVGSLSGGNQQKVLLAKWMFADPEVLIVDEPTRGIDVGAKYEIYGIMNDLVGQGKSIVMISSEMPELLGMCDRIYVMNEETARQ